MHLNVKPSCIADLAIQILFLHAVFIVEDASAAATGVKEQTEGVISGEGLYSASDKIVILNATNFKSSIYQSKTGWLVEFYNSWCGFCFRFAPTWKALGQNVERE